MTHSTDKLCTVLAVAAHPDDIEFTFAGTLLLLQEAGCEVVMWNLANGCLGSTSADKETTSATRQAEAKASAKLAGAGYLPPLFNDLEIFYDQPSLAKVAAGIRQIDPDIILTHSPQDYMEDHQNTCRLVTTAAFSRGMPGYQTNPTQATTSKPARIYHAAPHGLHDGMGTRFQPDFCVDIASVLDRKCHLLACHRSQGEWLKSSQEMPSFITEMVTMCEDLAAGDSEYQVAEGWRRHSHLGFCPPDYDPLCALLPNFIQPCHPQTAK
jgi:LmbE family N-acetylglucosaminyl deacetylase